jgi:mannose-6-phosphate isomerase-like protein (cupin superfamily)
MTSVSGSWLRVMVTSALSFAPFVANVSSASPALAGTIAPVAITDEVRRRPPDVRLGSTSIWHLSATPMQRTAIIVMRDGLPLHAHPDGPHYLYIVSGEMTAQIDGKSLRLKRGDYIAIPPHVPHRYAVRRGGRVMLLSMDSPPYDPTKTIWLEKKPGGDGFGMK